MEVEQEFDETVLILKDAKTAPDIVHDYTSKEQKMPLIMWVQFDFNPKLWFRLFQFYYFSDNGSCYSRVGFANHKTPQLIFRNLVAKPRKDRNKKETKEEVNIQPMTLIGNDILNIEAMRFQLRTQFDRNIVTHYFLQVNLLCSAPCSVDLTFLSLRSKSSITFSNTWESTRREAWTTQL